jgi:hypothetical protein
MGCLNAADALVPDYCPDPCPDGVPCCDSYAYYGPRFCVCWVRIYDQPREPAQPDMPRTTRASMCSDCAFRPGSPERTDSSDAVADSTDLMMIVHNPGQIFWCHDGMPRIIALEHPNGMRVDVPTEDGVVAYDPVIIAGVPYRGDGSPGLMCAGLAAARRAKDWLP